MPLDRSTQIPLFFNGATYYIWDEHAEDFRSNKPEETYSISRFRCNWYDRLTIIAAMLGGSFPSGGGSLHSIPSKYADDNALVARHARCTGEGVPSVNPNTNHIAFERAEVEICYKHPEYAPGSQYEIGDVELDFSSNTIALDPTTSSFKYDDGASPPNLIPPTQTPVLHYTTVMMTQTRYSVAQLPLDTIENLIDSVNSVPIFGRSKGKVLFHGARTNRRITVAGVTNWSVAFLFEMNKNGWNNTFNPKTGTWDPFVKQAGGKLFPEVDLNQLYANP